MKIAVDLLRALLGIVIGLVIIGLFPIYNEPFVGCQVRGFATLVRGCSLWPDFFMGLLSVIGAAMVIPRRLRPQLWGLAIVFSVAVLGGPEAIKTGMHLNIMHPNEMMFYWRGVGLALILGGLVGSVIFIGLSRWLEGRKARTQDMD